MEINIKEQSSRLAALYRKDNQGEFEAAYSEVKERLELMDRKDLVVELVREIGDSLHREA